MGEGSREGEGWEDGRGERAEWGGRVGGWERGEGGRGEGETRVKEERERREKQLSYDTAGSVSLFSLEVQVWDKLMM